MPRSKPIQRVVDERKLLPKLFGAYRTCARRSPPQRSTSPKHYRRHQLGIGTSHGHRLLVKGSDCPAFLLPAALSCLLTVRACRPLRSASDGWLPESRQSDPPPRLGVSAPVFGVLGNASVLVRLPKEPTVSRPDQDTGGDAQVFSRWHYPCSRHSDGSRKATIC